MGLLPHLFMIHPLTIVSLTDDSYTRRRFPMHDIILNIAGIRKTLIRRPVCFAAMLYLLLVLLMKAAFPSSIPDFDFAEGRFLRVSGKVLAREPSASGCRIILGEIRFSGKPSGQSSGYSELIWKLQDFWPARGRISILADQDEVFPSVRIGYRVTFEGKTSLPQPPTNPGQFDSRQYLHARNIYMQLTSVTLHEISEYTADRYLNFLSDLRSALKNGAAEVFGQRNSALIDAIILGDRSGLDAETRSLFQDGGILHILAVSSLHITLIGMSLYRLLRKLRRGFLFSSVCSGFLIVSFCIMSGNSFSAVRATIMFLFWLGAQITGRTCDRLTSLSFAALFILLRQPEAITDTAFLLSFSCILSLEVLVPFFQDIFHSHKGLPAHLVSSLALQTGILPLTLWSFYQMTPWGVLLNLIVIPSMSLFMVFGLLGCLLGLLIPLWSVFLLSARLIAGPCGYLLGLFRILCQIAQRLPGSILITGKPPAWKMILYYAVLISLYLIVKRMPRKTLLKNRKQIRLITSAVLFSLFLLLSFRKKPAFRLTCLDIGQGSCNLVEADGFVMLFDCGSSSVTDVYRKRVENTLKYYGISRIDLVFLSHGDSDHVCGFLEYLDGTHPSAAGMSAGGISVGRILVPQLRDQKEYAGLSEVMKAANEKQIPVSAVTKGSAFSRSGLSLQVLSPSPDRQTGSSNEDSILLLLRYKNIRIFFTGDLEKEGEQLFVREHQNAPLFQPSAGEDEEEPPITRTILVAGHHGSRYATSEELLSLLRPDLVLISCGRNNRYGHPAKQMINRLEVRRIPYHRTDRSGAFIYTQD